MRGVVIVALEEREWVHIINSILSMQMVRHHHTIITVSQCWIFIEQELAINDETYAIPPVVQSTHHNKYESGIRTVSAKQNT